MSHDAVGVPESLALINAKMAIRAGPSSRHVPWRDDRDFEAVISKFAAPYVRPERRALVSLWSQYYLAALIIPTTIALLRCDRVLPVGADDVAVEIDAAGQVERIWLRDDGHTHRDGGGGRFDTLVRGHIEPFIDACAARSRLSARVLWSNAAAILAYTIDELVAHPPSIEAACTEARLLLSAGGPAHPLGNLFDRADDGTLVRKVCCLRYRLAGIPRCAETCPLDRPDVAAAGRFSRRRSTPSFGASASTCVSR